MASNLDTGVLAIDGGGTRCRFALEVNGVRHVVALGSANATSDFDRAMQTIRDGIARLAAEAQVAPEALYPLPAYIGLAGILDDEDAARVRRALPFPNARIGDDRLSAVRGALGPRDGALAGLGTGSFFGRQSGGAIRLVGGWGSRLGDTASGFWIGREALSATLDTVDGLAGPTDLSDSLLARFNRRPQEIVAFALTATPAAMADLAPQVIAAANAGDRIGAAVLAAGARHIEGTLRAIGWTAGAPLCLIGGVADSYKPFLAQDLVASAVAPLGTALDGALLLARNPRTDLAS